MSITKKDIQWIAGVVAIPLLFYAVTSIFVTKSEARIIAVEVVESHKPGIINTSRENTLKEISEHSFKLESGVRIEEKIAVIDSRLKKIEEMLEYLIGIRKELTMVKNRSLKQ